MQIWKTICNNHFLWSNVYALARVLFPQSNSNNKVHLSNTTISHYNTIQNQRNNLNWTTQSKITCKFARTNTSQVLGYIRSKYHSANMCHIVIANNKALRITIISRYIFIQLHININSCQTLLIISNIPFNERFNSDCSKFWSSNHWLALLPLHLHLGLL